MRKFLAAALTLTSLLAGQVLDTRGVRPVYGPAGIPGDYQGDRQRLHQMYLYWSALGMASADPELQEAFRGLRLGVSPYLAGRSAPPPERGLGETRPRDVPQPSAPPPFVARTPDPGPVKPEHQALALELEARYDAAAAGVAAAWQGAEQLRLRLAADGYSMNVQTASSVARMTVFLDQAAEALRRQAWADATSALQKAEYETRKVLNTVGR